MEGYFSNLIYIILWKLDGRAFIKYLVGSIKYISNLFVIILKIFIKIIWMVQ